jgi:hypothetical protein
MNKSEPMSSDKAETTTAVQADGTESLNEAELEAVQGGAWRQGLVGLADLPNNASPRYSCAATGQTAQQMASNSPRI